MKHLCPGAQEPDAQGVQNHPLAPLDHTVRQVARCQAVDHSGEAFCDRLERAERQGIAPLPSCRFLPARVST